MANNRREFLGTMMAMGVFDNPRDDGTGPIRALGITQRVMNRDKITEAEAREKALAHLVPGVTLVPSGFLALAAAQQQGCSFITNT